MSVGEKRRISLEELKRAAEAQARLHPPGWLREELVKLGFAPDAVDRFLALRYGSARTPGETE